MKKLYLIAGIFAAIITILNNVEGAWGFINVFVASFEIIWLQKTLSALQVISQLILPFLVGYLVYYVLSNRGSQKVAIRKAEEVSDSTIEAANLIRDDTLSLAHEIREDTLVETKESLIPIKRELADIKKESTYSRIAIKLLSKHIGDDPYVSRQKRRDDLIHKLKTEFNEKDRTYWGDYYFGGSGMTKNQESAEANAAALRKG